MKPWWVIPLAAVLGCGGGEGRDDAARSLDARVETLDAGAEDAEPADAGGDAGSIDAADDARAVLDGGGAPVDAGAERFDTVLAALERCDAGAFDEAMQDVAWHEGWPLHVGTRWLFATRFSEAVAGTSLVGDVNGWDTTRWPGTRCDGRRYFVALNEAEFGAAAEGAKYKWFVVADGSYRPPNEATQYGYDEFGRFGWVRAARGVAHLEQFPGLASAALPAPRALRVYVPAGFEPGGGAATRTLLLHDGQNVFHPDAAFGGWRVDEALRVRGSDIVAVAIDNAIDRMDAYTQISDDIGDGPVGGQAHAYLALVRDQALPFVRARYGIAAEGPSLMMAGSSLGGLVTLVAAHDGLSSVGCAAAMSSTVGWGSIAPAAPPGRTLLHTWRGVHAPLYLDTGGSVAGACRDSDADGVDDDGEDSDNYCVNVQLRGVLERAGYVRGTNLHYRWAEGARHDEAAWAARIGEAIDVCTAMGWSAH